tara:strand:- start:3657 stop:4859 length:1203 start_codon:yes stop_codon:yes gene_type:complete
MSKQVLFYIPDLDQTVGGIRQYALNLLETIAGLDKGIFQIYVYHNVEDSQVIDIIDKNENCTLITDVDIYTPFINRKNYWRKKGMLLSQLLVGKQPYRFKEIAELDHFVQNKEIDFIHVPYQYLPKTKSKVKIITTLHDVQELYFPEFFKATNRAFRAQMYLDCVTKSHKIIVSYEHIAQDLKKYFNANPQKLQVCLLNMKDLWFAKIEEKLQGVFPPSPFKEEYILFPANFWKHKNHNRLIEAFAIYKAKSNSDLKLVLTGYNKNEVGLEAQQLGNNLGILNSIVFAGLLDEEELYATYKNAHGVVIPTLYEAGSFPLMESLILEIPVICSNVTSLPETIGDDQFVFNPFNVNDIAEKISLLAEDEKFREQSILNCKKMSTRIKDTGAEEIIKNIYLNA